MQRVSTGITAMELAFRLRDCHRKVTSRLTARRQPCTKLLQLRLFTLSASRPLPCSYLLRKDSGSVRRRAHCGFTSTQWIRPPPGGPVVAHVGLGSECGEESSCTPHPDTGPCRVDAAGDRRPDGAHRATSPAAEHPHRLADLQRAQGWLHRAARLRDPFGRA